MPKALLRIVVFLLVPSLLAEPALAVACSQDRPIFGGVIHEPFFTQAALVSPLVILRNNPINAGAEPSSQRIRRQVDGLYHDPKLGSPTLSLHRKPLGLIVFVGNILIAWVRHWNIWSHEAYSRGIPGRVAAAIGGLLEEECYGLVAAPLFIYLLRRYVPDVESNDLRVSGAMVFVQFLFMRAHGGDLLFTQDGTGRIRLIESNTLIFWKLAGLQALNRIAYLITYLFLTDRHVGAAQAAAWASQVTALFHVLYNGRQEGLLALPPKVVIWTRSFLMAA